MCTFAYVFSPHAYARDMKYAIIAAGRGSRLREEGINTPKPLVELNGEKLIDRLIRIFICNGATEIIVICNELYPEVDHHLTSLEKQGLPVRHIVKDTASSMHSLHEIAQQLQGDKFILTTVDTVFSERMFSQFVKAFNNSKADGIMAVTDYCDDEKPLYVLTDNVGKMQLPLIKGFYDEKPTCNKDETTYVSAGIYGLSSPALTILEQCISKGMSRMRNFQRALIDNGQQLRAFSLGMVMDIDHRSDLDVAQRFTNPRRLLGIYRAQRFSPNSIEKDCAIMDAVLKKAQSRGYIVDTVSEEEIIESGILPPADKYISMARSNEALMMLKGAPCVNSVKGIQACNNRSYVAETANPPLWIKRADDKAHSEGDVLYCATLPDLQKALAQFKAQGIDNYIMQPHYEGHHIKFYGVLGTTFFWASYHAPMLKQAALRLATSLSVPVFGGDAILSADGTLHIVDFNDWPSFAPCISEAANAIVSVIKQ